jgi:hypothetical protein
MSGQLSLFAEADGELMSADELDAVRREFAARVLEAQSHEVRTNGANRPKRCRCERPLVFRDEGGGGRCHWCGRASR